MDTVTQIALGAAVGEATLGHKVGNRAIYWGGALALIPDLDAMIAPLLSETQALAIHRAFLHSILFTLLAAPLIGAFLHRWHDQTVRWKQWSLFVFWLLSTHIALDCLTTYGTQIFQPFTNYKVSLSTIFVVDPLYTVPLLIGVVAALRRPAGSLRRRRINYLGLGISSLYLVFTFVVKGHVESVFQKALQDENIAYERLKTTPTPFNSLLWMGLTEHNDTLSVGLYSILDDNAQVTFKALPKRSPLLANLRHEQEVQRLLWFSEGYYTVNQQAGILYFNDLRFGRSDVWLTNKGSYVFSWKLVQPENNPHNVTAVHHRPSRGTSMEVLRRFGRRILGDESVSKGLNQETTE